LENQVDTSFAIPGHWQQGGALGPKRILALAAAPAALV